MDYGEKGPENRELMVSKWAIMSAVLVVLMVLELLVLTGIIYYPRGCGGRVLDQCNFRVGILCTSAKVDVGGEITLELQNTLSRNISICKVGCAKTAENGGLLAELVVPNCAAGGYLAGGLIVPGQETTVTDTVDTAGGGCWGDEDGASDEDKVGEGIRGKVYIWYSQDGDTGNARITVGDMQTNIQP